MTDRIEPGLAYEGERAYVLTHTERHGSHIRQTKDLTEGTPITRVVFQTPAPKNYPYPLITTTAFRSADHARAWFDLTHKE